MLQDFSRGLGGGGVRGGRLHINICRYVWSLGCGRVGRGGWGGDGAKVGDTGYSRMEDSALLTFTGDGGVLATVTCKVV